MLSLGPNRFCIDGSRFAFRCHALRGAGGVQNRGEYGRVARQGNKKITRENPKRDAIFQGPVHMYNLHSWKDKFKIFRWVRCTAAGVTRFESILDPLTVRVQKDLIVKTRSGLFWLLYIEK